MDFITILEEKIRKENQKNWFSFLLVQKLIVEKYFNWIDLHIDTKKRALIGTGSINLGSKYYSFKIFYSPFYKFRYDKIFINNKYIPYDDSIHIYTDLSLCLYHPIIDQPILQKVPLYKIIPWITEWVVYYEQWKKYGVWLGREIKHQSL